MTLKKDTELSFPHYIVLKASAGAGKTRALTSRYVQFLLSERIPFNSLKNILAITFSNNAAKEMKDRILGWLKQLYHKEPEAVREFSSLLESSHDSDFEEYISRKAGNAIEEILRNYSDFQVRTIDSFMSSIFRSSATDFGYTHDFEILMSKQELFSYAFELFLRDVKDGSEKASRFEEIIELITEMKSENSSYPWNPSEELFKKWKEFYRTLSSKTKPLKIQNGIMEEKRQLEERLKEVMEEITAIVSNIPEKFINKKYKVHKDFPSIIQNRRYHDLIKGESTTHPLKKGYEKEYPYEHKKIKDLWERFSRFVSEYALCSSIADYHPYMSLFNEFLEVLEKVKQREGKVFIEDINRTLARSLNNDIIPDIYFRLGERIYHYLIDEFQDTSPLQWANLKPLIENALSANGSLFVVGDTKQAIYGFRGADYRIMGSLEKEDAFPSALKSVNELNINRRSAEEIIRFSEKVFKEIAPSKDEYREALSLSGLQSYKQYPDDKNKGRGYVEVRFLKEDNELSEYIVETIKNLTERGYAYSDISILAHENEDVVNISGMLNEKGIPFLSYSSLDVRKRNVISGILHLLSFLDSPVDDFPFIVFLKSPVYKKYLSSLGKEDLQSSLETFIFKYRDESRLYKHFEREFPERWKEDFEPLFRLAGYLPLYDLLSMIAGKFRIFEIMPEEEASLLKLFELARTFESRGFGNIKDFVEFLTNQQDDSRLWDISLPSNINAVSLMTIHQSKGLEFPVSIVYLKKPKDNNRNLYPLEDEEAVYLLKLTEQYAKKNETLRCLYEQKRLDELTSKFNILYVGLTRAKEELYVAVKDENKRDKFPLDLLKDEDGRSTGKKPSGELIKELKSRVPSVQDKYHFIETVFLSHYPFFREFRGDEREIHLFEKERGEFIHKVLATIEYDSEDLPRRLSEKIERLNSESTYRFNAEEVNALLLGIVRSSPLSPYFERLECRQVRNEKEFSDSRGALYRMDRVVIDTESVTVIDYKTGHPAEEELNEHKAQVTLYKSILKDIYPQKRIKGLIYYIDKGEVKEV